GRCRRAHARAACAGGNGARAHASRAPVITPRQTRLVRVPDLHVFRRVIRTLSGPPPRVDVSVIVPTKGAAGVLSAAVGGSQALVTREELYAELAGRLDPEPRLLSQFERDSLMQAAAAGAAEASPGLPFQIRPGLVAEILRF